MVSLCIQFIANMLIQLLWSRIDGLLVCEGFVENLYEKVQNPLGVHIDASRTGRAKRVDLGPLERRILRRGELKGFDLESEAFLTWCCRMWDLAATVVNPVAMARACNAAHSTWDPNEAPEPDDHALKLELADAFKRVGLLVTLVLDSAQRSGLTQVAAIDGAIRQLYDRIVAVQQKTRSYSKDKHKILLDGENAIRNVLDPDQLLAIETDPAPAQGESSLISVSDQSDYQQPDPTQQTMTVSHGSRMGFVVPDNRLQQHYQPGNMDSWINQLTPEQPSVASPTMTNYSQYDEHGGINRHPRPGQYYDDGSGYPPTFYDNAYNDYSNNPDNYGGWSG